MNLEEINKLPYYHDWKPDGRSIAILAFCEEGNFQIPFIVDGQVKIIHPSSAYHCVYKAKEPADKENDYYLLLIRV